MSKMETFSDDIERMLLQCCVDTVAYTQSFQECLTTLNNSKNIMQIIYVIQFIKLRVTNLFSVLGIFILRKHVLSKQDYLQGAIIKKSRCAVSPHQLYCRHSYTRPTLMSVSCESIINKCIGDDTKAAACRSPNSIRKTK